MTSRITQIDDKYGAMALLRVEGSLRLEDAELLVQFKKDADRGVTVECGALSPLVTGRRPY